MVKFAYDHNEMDMKLCVADGEEELIEALKEAGDIPNDNTKRMIDFSVLESLITWVRVYEEIEDCEKLKIYSVPVTSAKVLQIVIPEAIRYFEKYNIKYWKENNWIYNAYGKREV